MVFHIVLSGVSEQDGRLDRTDQSAHPSDIFIRVKYLKIIAKRGVPGSSQDLSGFAGFGSPDCGSFNRRSCGAAEVAV
jgi:hypothetical protein